MTLIDARGVEIAPGDTCLYGFGVGRSIAMAEGSVLGEVDPVTGGRPLSVSLTPSGRVRIRVVRRSYSSGEKPVVDVAPDRLVVLKHVNHCFAEDYANPILPPSPLPTQDEEARKKLERDVEYRTENLRVTEAPEYWKDDLASYLTFQAKQLEDARRKLRDLDG